MPTTFDTIPIVARDAEALISPFTLLCIHARDLMVDSSGVLSFFYGAGRPVRRVEVRQTAPEVYSVEVGHIDPRTHEWTLDTARHNVPAGELRDAIQELT